jgi:HSP20 family protein
MTRLFGREPFGELWGEVNRISEEMNRLFGARGQGALPVNLWADEQNLYAEFDLPDVDPAKLDVTVTEGTKLSISGERPAPEETGAVWVRQERPFGTFSREVTLPVLVDADKVQAAYENGVLKLTLPKSEAAKPRKIAVNS